MKFDRTLETKPVEFCGHKLFIKEWSAKQYELFEKASLDGSKIREDGEIQAFIISMSLVDENGKQVSTVDEIGELPTRDVTPLYLEIIDFQVSSVQKRGELKKS